MKCNVGCRWSCLASDKIRSWFRSFAIFLPAEDFNRVPHSASHFSLSLSYPHDGSTSISRWGISCQYCPEFPPCSQPIASMWVENAASQGWRSFAVFLLLQGLVGFFYSVNYRAKGSLIFVCVCSILPIFSTSGMKSVSVNPVLPPPSLI